MKKHISETQMANSSRASQTKTLKTSNKKSEFNNGLSVKESLNQLTSSISIAKGVHAILYSKLRDSTARTAKMEPEHLQILSKDLMDEIWNAEAIVTNLLNDPRLTV